MEFFLFLSSSPAAPFSCSSSVLRLTHIFRPLVLQLCRGTPSSLTTVCAQVSAHKAKGGMRKTDSLSTCNPIFLRPCWARGLCLEGETVRGTPRPKHGVECYWTATNERSRWDPTEKLGDDVPSLSTTDRTTTRLRQRCLRPWGLCIYTEDLHCVFTALTATRYED